LLEERGYACRLPLAACRLPLAACRLPLAACRLPLAANYSMYHQKYQALKSCLFTSFHIIFDLLNNIFALFLDIQSAYSQS
jgi:hypothetical protein